MTEDEAMNKWVELNRPNAKAEAIENVIRAELERHRKSGYLLLEGDQKRPEGILLEGFLDIRALAQQIAKEFP